MKRTLFFGACAELQVKLKPISIAHKKTQARFIYIPWANIKKYSYCNYEEQRPCCLPVIDWASPRCSIVCIRQRLGPKEARRVNVFRGRIHSMSPD